MKLLRGLAAACLALVPVAASCADSSSGSDAPPESHVVPPVDGGGDLGDAGVDADADATAELRADFVPVPTPLTTAFLLLSVWGTGPTDAWAVGSGGIILHWNGTAWTSIASPTPSTFHAVSGSGPNDVWVAASRSGIYHGLGLSNGAMQWAPRPPAVTAFDFDLGFEPLVNSVWVGAPSEVLVAGDSVQTIDKCRSQWRANLAGTSVVSWSPLFDMSCNTFDAVTVNDRTTIFGMTAASDALWAVGGDSYRGFVVGRAFRSSRSAPFVDAGTTPPWEEIDTQASVRLGAVWGTDAGGVWAVGEQGTIRHLEAGDVRFRVIESPTEENLTAIWGSAANDIWAVGEHATLLHFDGRGWSLEPVGVKADLHGVWGSGPNDVWAVGEGTVLHFTGRKKK